MLLREVFTIRKRNLNDSGFDTAQVGADERHYRLFGETLFDLFREGGIAWVHRKVLEDFTQRRKENFSGCRRSSLRVRVIFAPLRETTLPPSKLSHSAVDPRVSPFSSRSHENAPHTFRA